MRKKQELEAIKSFVDNTYSRYGNLLLVNTEKPYDAGHTALGFCFKHKDPKTGHVIYKIECAHTGIDRLDFKVMMHEYGHIYLGHLDGISEDLDAQIYDVLEVNRPELIKSINESCQIDFGDKLIERVIDDPEVNHALHNIAMDFSVNTKVLSPEDIEEMEKDLTSLLPKTQEEFLDYMAKNSISDADKKKYQDALDKMKKEGLIKLMIPSRYNLGPELDANGNPIPAVDENGNPMFHEDGTPIFKVIPFPDDLEYSDYLLLIISHLDQFVKMLVSLMMGGNGDTSQVSQRDIQNALQNAQNQWNERSEEYKQGYNDALNDYKNNQLGNKQHNPQNQQNGQQQGQSGQQGQQNGQGQNGQQSGQQGQGGQQASSQGGQSGNTGGQQNGGQSGQQSGSGAGQGNQSQSGGQGQSQGNGGGQSSNPNAQSDYDQGYQDALNDIANSQGKGNGGGMQGLNDMMSQAGMSDPNGNGNGEGQGQDGQGGQNGQGQGNGSGNGNGKSGQGGPGRATSSGENINDQDYGKDHGTDSRDEADEKRKLGQISSSGGFGCGKSGGPEGLRDVSKNLDDVDMALTEVLTNIKHKVIKMKQKKDLMKLYNRGVNRTVIVPSWSTKTTYDIDPTIVFLIDISGSMDTQLIDRCLGTINNNLRKINRGLKYNIITWSTCLGEHIRDIDPKKGVPSISCGGGTSLARGIKYFKDNYDENAILVIISDFEDDLQDWHSVESSMPKYSMYGFNYGTGSYNDSDRVDWSYLKVRKFNQR